MQGKHSELGLGVAGLVEEWNLSQVSKKSLLNPQPKHGCRAPADLRVETRDGWGGDCHA